MNRDRPTLGILLMLGFCALAPLSDSIAKILGDQVSLGQLLGVRFAIQVVLLLPLVVFARLRLRVSPRMMVLITLRTGLHIMGIGGMFLALRFLPLADAVAIAFVMPFIMLILGKTVLNEEIGKHRLSACAVGFVGTLLVVQPSFANVGAPALLPLFVALVFALFMLTTRQMAKQIDAVPLQFISGIVASFVLIPFLLLSPDSWSFSTITKPDLNQAWLLLALGCLGTFAHLLMTWSLRFAPTATLAPMQYLEIPFAVVFGWLFFRDIPGGAATVGIGITIAAGLYVFHRERINSASAPLSPAPGAP